MRELELLQLQRSLEESQEPYALATVVKVRGSASAKPGSKCLVSKEGKNLWGWVGGGCAESFTITQALEAMRERQPRVITADLDDEIFGLGMPCGGTMEIYVEPRFPREVLRFANGGSAAFRAFVEHFGFQPAFGEGPCPTRPAEWVKLLAHSLALSRGVDLQPLSPGAQTHLASPPTQLLILGHSRITEELAKLGALLGWPTQVYGIGMDPTHYPSTVRATSAQPDYAGLTVRPGSCVIVASHHKGDHHYIREALEAGAAYVGLVASHKRSRLVFEHLEATGVTAEKIAQVKAPAGLKLECKNPGEIALSVFAQLV